MYDTLLTPKLPIFTDFIDVLMNVTRNVQLLLYQYLELLIEFARRI